MYICNWWGHADVVNKHYNKSFILPVSVVTRKEICDFKKSLDRHSRNQFSTRLQTYDKIVIYFTFYRLMLLAVSALCCHLCNALKQVIVWRGKKKSLFLCFLCSAICIILSGHEDKWLIETQKEDKECIYFRFGHSAIHYFHTVVCFISFIS